MIIDSSFHDYYDCIAKQGVDRSVRYKREPKSINFEIKNRPPYWYHGNNHRIIWFCGRLFPFVRMHVTECGATVEERYCFSMDEVDEWQKSHLSARSYQAYLRGKGWRSWTHRRDEYTKRFEGEFLDEARKALGKLADSIGCPILNYHHQSKEVGLNVRLKDFAFYRVIDPFTAYQEIFMFLSNIAQPEKVIPHVSDADMITAKGFDRFSFRKDKQK